LFGGTNKERECEREERYRKKYILIHRLNLYIRLLFVGKEKVYKRHKKSIPKQTSKIKKARKK
jgi:hypothetical protein